jgi:adenosylmethionine-8-amino-7-oxononanoate aminotransferase
VLTAQVVADLPRDHVSTDLFERTLEHHAHELAAIIVEPLVQGAGGMLFHPPDVLRRLRDAADRHGVLLIFDEIFTGFGRTGTMFACEQAGVVPDILTLSKALTGGTMALSATIATREVFEGFWSDDSQHALMHGPTYMANPLACAAALASLDLFAAEDRLGQVAAISSSLTTGLAPCRDLPGVRDVRVLGAIGVVELEQIDRPDLLRARFVEAGAWIRPFRNIVYLTPSFTIAPAELETLTSTIRCVLADLPRP